MWGYIFGGAAIGAIIGYVVPPGYCFWFVIGAVSGWLMQRYVSRRY